jgi:hypothetical protein
VQQAREIDPKASDNFRLEPLPFAQALPRPAAVSHIDRFWLVRSVYASIPPSHWHAPSTASYACSTWAWATGVEASASVRSSSPVSPSHTCNHPRGHGTA